MLPRFCKLGGKVVAVWLSTGEIIAWGNGPLSRSIAEMILMPLHKPDSTWKQMYRFPPADFVAATACHDGAIVLSASGETFLFTPPSEQFQQGRWKLIARGGCFHGVCYYLGRLYSHSKFELFCKPNPVKWRRLCTINWKL